MKGVRLAVLFFAGLMLVGMISVARASTHGKDNSDRQAQASKNQAQSATDSPQNASPALSAILLVNSKGCQCTRERCQSAETIMQQVRKEYSGAMAYETVDWELQHERASALVKEFKVFIIPTLIVLDNKKNAVWRCEDFSKKELVHAKFKELVQKESAVSESKQ